MERRVSSDNQSSSGNSSSFCSVDDVEVTSDMDNDVVEVPVENTTQDENSKQKCRSIVWQHFNKVDNKLPSGETMTTANCKHCKTGKYKLSGKSKGSTTNLAKHLKAAHPKIAREAGVIEAPSNTKEATKTHFSLSNTKSFIFSQTKFRECLLRWVVVSNQPHTEVEAKSFRQLVQSLNLEAKLISADTLKKDLMQAHECEISKLKLIIINFPGKLSYTLDGWTAPNVIPFLGITGHWITSDWKPIDILIGFQELTGSHTGKRIYRAFLDCLSSFDLGDLKKMQAVTTDNATNNDTFFIELQADHPGQVRIRCFAHILNLAVQCLLKQLKVPETTAIADVDDTEVVDNEYEYTTLDSDEENALDIFDTTGELGVVGDIIIKMRKLVKKIRASPQCRKKFGEACVFQGIEPKQLILDVKTRWNSTYAMIKRAVEMKTALDTLCANPGAKHFKLKSLLINQNEWELLEPIIQLLGHFDRATMHMSLSRYPSIASTIPMYYWLKEKMEDFETKHKGVLQSACKSAREKLKEYEPDFEKYPACAIALVLNPTLKLEYFKEHAFSSRIKKKIKDLVIDTFKNNYEPLSSEPQYTPVLQEDFLQYLHKRSRLEETQSEIEKYLSQPRAGVNVKILDWWKVHEADYPNVARMARDYLAIASTSVPIESQFSGGTNLVVPNRGSLCARTICASMCLRSWWRTEDLN